MRNNTSFKPGHKHSEETKAKMSASRKGKTPWNKGVPMSDEIRAKVSVSRKGKPGGKVFVKGQIPWNKGIGNKTTEQKKIRTSLAYKEWRNAVFTRDNFTCVFCGEKGGILNADHIKRFADFPELRLDVNNGRTLCEKCHKTTDTYGNRKNKNTETLKYRCMAVA